MPESQNGWPELAGQTVTSGRVAEGSFWRRRLELYGPWALLLLAALTSLAVAVAALPPGNDGRGNAVVGDATPPAGTDQNLTPSATDSSDVGSTLPDGASTFTPDPGPTPRPHKAARPKSVPPTELTGYEWPLRNAFVTSRFAPRDFGGFLVIEDREFHDGLDLATHCGDKVLAAHDGKVLYAGRNFDVFLGYRGKPEQIYARLEQQGRVNTLPIVIVVDDGNGYRSLYVHLSKAQVEAGDLVRAGDVIGLEGRTGLATGCHLHYGIIRMDGGWQQVLPKLARFGYPTVVRERIDPLKVLPWDDEFAPQRLRDRVLGTASPSAVPTAVPTASPTASP